MKYSQKGFALYLVIILVALLAIGGGAYFYLSKKPAGSPVVVIPAKNSPVVNNSVVNNNAEVKKTPPPVVAGVSDEDINRVKAILEDIRQGYLTGDTSLIIKHSSVETASFFSAGKPSPVSIFIVNSVSKLGSNIKANVTINSEAQDMVFIKEGGDWKMDITASFDLIFLGDATKKGTGDPKGYIDLVVTGITVFPSHPVVNDKDVKIIVSIKNTGTKTSDNGSLATGELLGFADGFPIDGGVLSPLTPGETGTWNYHPYGGNDFFKVSDTPGQKTIKIVLNGDRTVIESNYDNNTFTQAVEMYAN